MKYIFLFITLCFFYLNSYCQSTDSIRVKLGLNTIIPECQFEYYIDCIKFSNEQFTHVLDSIISLNNFNVKNTFLDTCSLIFNTKLIFEIDGRLLNKGRTGSINYDYSEIESINQLSSLDSFRRFGFQGRHGALIIKLKNEE